MSERQKLPRGQGERRTRLRLRLWMAVNGLVLVALVWGVVAAVGSHDAVARRAPRTAANASSQTAASAQGGSGPTGGAKSASPQLPTKQEILALPGRYFGVSGPDLPWSSEDMAKVAVAAQGVAPNIAEYFVNFKTDFDPVAVASAYKHGALPLISWEPWDGSKGTVAQDAAEPEWALRTIVAGKHDDHIAKFAAAVAAAKVPVAIRFAHEMNGDWYPWGTGVNGNAKGEYVAAWRHVHDLFAKAGATNVIWVWSPNNLEGAGGAQLRDLYPGDANVDWIGLSAYLTNGHSAATVIEPALKAVRAFTQKKLLVTETGAEPGATKAARISGLFTWLDKHPDVIGFVWFQTTKTTGAGADWRFDADAASKAAFDGAITHVVLAHVPVVDLGQ